MNYQKIHDILIDRSRDRIHDKTIHHLHHIIPRHEDPTSTEVVSLTFKEHRIVHYLRYKLTGTAGNFLAYRMMKSTGDNVLSISSEAGKIGGANTRKNNSGIFSQNYDRAAQSRKNSANGIAGFNVISREENSRLGVMGGNITKKNKLGIFAATDEQRSKWGKENGSIGGQKAKSEKLGFHAFSKEERMINASKGGKVGGKIVGKLLWWTNGKENMKAHSCDLIGWKRGMTKGLKPNVEYKLNFKGKK